MSGGTIVRTPVQTPVRLVDQFTKDRFFLVHGRKALVKSGRIEIHGDARRVLLVHPPAGAAFQIPGEGGRFSFGVAIHPAVWDNPQCGPCEFLVLLGDRPIFHGLLDVRDCPEERRWHDVTLDIEASGASVSLLTLMTRSEGDEAYRWALFSEPVFLPAGCDDGASIAPAGAAPPEDSVPSGTAPAAAPTEPVPVVHEAPKSGRSTDIDATIPRDISNVAAMDPTDAGQKLRLPPATPGAAVVFIHVPRTAGTTLRGIVQRQFDPASVQHLYGHDCVERLKRFRFRPRSERARVRLLLGHFALGMHEYLVGPAAYVSVVREPVDRIVSDYYYILGNKDHEHHRLLTSRKMSLQDFIECPQFLSNDNGLVRTFVGGPFVPRPFGSINRDDLALAKRNILEHVSVLGLTERFHDTLALLHLKLGWRGLYYVPQNVGSGRPPRARISAADAAAIERFNALDVELYRFCAEAFAAEVARLGPAFAEVAERLATQNRRLMDLRARCEERLLAHDYEGATRLAQEAVAIEPCYAPGHHLLSVAAFHAGRTADASLHATRALQCDPYDPQVCRHAANLLGRAGRPDLARDLLLMHLDKFNAYHEGVLQDVQRLDEAEDRRNPLIALCSRMAL